IHADLDVHDRHDRRERPKRAVEHILRSWLFANADCEYAGGGGTLNAGNITAQSAELLFLFVEFFLGNDFEIGLLRLFVCHVGLLGLAFGGADHDVTLPTRRVMNSRSDCSAAFSTAN